LRERYSEGTVKRIHSIMNSVLNDTVHEFRILHENPLVKITIPKETDRNYQELKYFTREQPEKFLEEVKKPQKHAKYQHSIQYYVLLFWRGLVYRSEKHWR
jgi:hypothetical protein